MKFRTAILFLGVLFLGSFGLLVLAAQDAGQAELPSAPSASQPSRSQKTAPAVQQAAPPAQQTAQQPPKAGTPSTSALPAGGSPSDDDSLTTIRHTVNEVNVVFTVTDKHGRYVRDLKKEDFKVVDDNKPASDIRSFHAETNLPLEVGLLVDASNSVRDRFKFEQEAATEFLNQTIRPRYDEAFVILPTTRKNSRSECARCDRAAAPRCMTHSILPAVTSS